MIFLIAINTMVFLALSALHFYWAWGGRWGWHSTLPTKPDGQFLFTPSAGSTLVVAIGLLIFSLITFGNSGILDRWLDRAYIHYGTWIITIIFALRSIGDIKFIGFTKKIKGTKFADNDTKIYSPLCLTVAFFSFVIAVFL